MKNREEKQIRNEQLRQEGRQKYQEIMADLRNPVKKAVRSRKISMTATSILRGIIIAGLSFVIVFPIFQQLTQAFKDPADLANPLIVWIPEKFSIVNFQIAMELTDYWRALLNNIRVSALTTVCQVAATALAGYAFARLKFKGSNILFWLIMLTFIMPPQTTAASRALFFSNFDIFGIIKAITNSTRGISIRGPGKDYIFYIMAITGQGIRAALFVYLFRQFFRGIPIELEESAQIDGAGIVRTFWSVMLPNARGVMTTVALFAFVWQWNDVYYTSMFGVSSSDFPLLTIQIINTAEWLGNLLIRLNPEYGISTDIKGSSQFTSLIANTEAFLMMLPLLIAYMFVQKLFVEGIERTGIVG